jgi:hypothetical protein
MLAKKQQPVIAPSDEETIAAGCNAAQGVIARHVDQLKASRDGASTPKEVLRQMTMAGSSCVCRIAGHLLEKERQAKERERGS